MGKKSRRVKEGKEMEKSTRASKGRGGRENVGKKKRNTNKKGMKRKVLAVLIQRGRNI